MLHDLIQKYRGKETVVMTDSFAKCKARQRVLENSRRGEHQLSFRIQESEETTKYKKKHKFRSH